MARKLTVKSTNAEVYVSGYNTYINDNSLSDIINDNIKEGTFRAKVTILIEEIESDLLIEGNKHIPDLIDEEELELEDEF
jgi:hypothetical protein